MKQIEVVKKELGFVATIPENLTINNCDDFFLLIDEIDFSRGKKILAVNMTDISYLDSSGISILLKVSKVLKNKGVSFRLFALKKNIQKIIMISKLDRIFLIFNSETDALKYVESADSNRVSYREFKMIFPADFFFLPSVIDFILCTIQQNFIIDEEERVKFVVTLEESLTNSIEHGYRDVCRTGMIQAWCFVVSDYIIVAVDDYGQGFDKTSIMKRIKEVPNSPMAVRGRGIFIINELMDELTCESAPREGSIFFFAKQLKRKD